MLRFFTAIGGGGGIRKNADGGLRHVKKVPNGTFFFYCNKEKVCSHGEKHFVKIKKYEILRYFFKKTLDFVGHLWYNIRVVRETPRIIKKRLVLKMAKIGDKIVIENMYGEPQYTGATGTITYIDDIGQLHGTWGGCAVIPSEDTYRVIEESK